MASKLDEIHLENSGAGFIMIVNEYISHKFFQFPNSLRKGRKELYEDMDLLI